MKKVLILSMLVAHLCACNSLSSKCLVVDLRNYADLEDNAHFMMLFSNPLDFAEQDTIYWTGNKKFIYALDDSSQDFLAFVDVYVIPDNEDEFNTLLFKSVVAIDGNEAIICADNRYTVRLSGTPSNKMINDLRTEQFKGEIPCGVDTMAFMKNYILNEMSEHSNDLYGAYIYSYLSFMRLGEFEETDDFSACMFVQQLIQEEMEADTYLSKHNIALPIFERVKMIGDISSTLILEFVRYMYPSINTPPTHEYSKSENVGPSQSMEVIYIVVDSLNQISMGMNRDELQLVTLDELDTYFAQDIDPSVLVNFQASKYVRMSTITGIKQTIRKYHPLKICYSSHQK